MLDCNWNAQIASALIVIMGQHNYSIMSLVVHLQLLIFFDKDTNCCLIKAAICIFDKDNNCFFFY